MAVCSSESNLIKSFTCTLAHWLHILLEQFGVQNLAHRHFDMQTGGARDRIADLRNSENVTDVISCRSTLFYVTVVNPPAPPRLVFIYVLSWLNLSMLVNIWQRRFFKLTVFDGLLMGSCKFSQKSKTLKKKRTFPYWNVLTKPMLYILLSCVLTLSQLFLTMFRPREICNFNHGLCHVVTVACKWHCIPFAHC